MSEIASLGYLVINASDLDHWESFACNLLGMQVGQRTEDLLTLRMDERQQRIIIESGRIDDLTALGWEFNTQLDLAVYLDNLLSKGIEIREHASAEALQRGVEALFSCADPNGLSHEFYYGPTFAPISQPFSSPVLSGAGFETGDLGVGHALVVAKDYAQSVNFYTETLGLKISDYIRDSGVFPGVTVDATFMHTRTGRHHSLATTAIPSEKILNHMMVQVKSLDDLGLAYDRLREAGVPVIMDIGHHPNDRMTSFYVVTPSGFGLEYGWGGVVINDDEWTIKNYSELSDWGHKFQR